jgi:hypothetical protein
MKLPAVLAEKLDERGSPADPGYDAWKQGKIERAKAQAIERSSMIPAEQLWRELGSAGEPRPLA